MGIKIHHGPDGTFKTSGAIKDDIIPVIKNGRTLVTNIRGFSRKNAVKVLGRKKVHKNFNVIFVDTEGKEGRDKLARFFHWAPNGSFFVIDEVQRIFKPRWTQKDLTLLDYPGGDLQAERDNRPEDIHTAWDMQRHYNWDFVFTTTSISKVRSEMKDMAKIAIRHYNLNLWRFYKTVEHDCDSKGKTYGQQGTIKTFNWVSKKIFNLYSSTKTDSFTNSEPRTPIYRDPKILGLLIALACFWTWILNKPVPNAIRKNPALDTQTIKADINKEQDSNNIKVGTVNTNRSVSHDANNHVTDKLYFEATSIEPLLLDSQITGHYGNSYAFKLKYNGTDQVFTSMHLKDKGYKVTYINPCTAKISRGGKHIYLHCGNALFDTIQNEKPNVITSIQT